jgi:hypothetical protein
MFTEAAFWGRYVERSGRRVRGFKGITIRGGE